MSSKLLIMDRKHLMVVFIISIIIFSSVCTIMVINSRRTISEIHEADEDTLRFVQVIFRHGERANVKWLLAPNDPHINFTYPPYGCGALTNKGKKQAYEIGRQLRQRYNKFLGDYYSSDLINTLSSATQRSQITLQLVLAGMFPPKNEQIWQTGLNWQPIAYKTTTVEKNTIFGSVFCPHYCKIYREFVNSPTMQQYYQDNKDFNDYVSLHSGWNIITPAKLYLLHESLRIDEIFGLNLPKWTLKIYPQPLQRYADLAIKTFCGTDTMKRLFVGYLLRQLTNEIYDKIDGKISTKLALYSGHDINIAGIGEVFNLFDSHVIPFSAYILIELHEMENNYVLKFYYQNYTQPALKAISLIPGAEFITMDKYSNLVEKYLPEDNECEEGPNGLEPYNHF